MHLSLLSFKNKQTKLLQTSCGSGQHCGNPVPMEVTIEQIHADGKLDQQSSKANKDWECLITWGFRFSVGSAAEPLRAAHVVSSKRLCSNPKIFFAKTHVWFQIDRFAYLFACLVHMWCDFDYLYSGLGQFGLSRVFVVWPQTRPDRPTWYQMYEDATYLLQKCSCRI